MGVIGNIGIDGGDGRPYVVLGVPGGAKVIVYLLDRQHLLVILIGREFRIYSEFRIMAHTIHV